VLSELLGKEAEIDDLALAAGRGSATSTARVLESVLATGANERQSKPPERGTEAPASDG